MLRPSYAELIESLNKQEDQDLEINSRYTIVIAAAKRARQLIGGAPSLAVASSDKAVSTAIAEMNKGKIVITKSIDSEESSVSSGNLECLSHEDLSLS